jgi:hypothetical protein
MHAVPSQLFSSLADDVPIPLPEGLRKSACLAGSVCQAEAVVIAGD